MSMLHSMQYLGRNHPSRADQLENSCSFGVGQEIRPCFHFLFSSFLFLSLLFSFLFFFFFKFSSPFAFDRSEIMGCCRIREMDARRKEANDGSTSAPARLQFLANSPLGRERAAHLPLFFSSFCPSLTCAKSRNGIWGIGTEKSEGATCKKVSGEVARIFLACRSNGISSSAESAQSWLSVYPPHMRHVR